MKEKKYRKGVVSIVIPTYNQSQFISETIESVLSQTYSNLEIIIADDCSTDGTAEIIQGYAKKDDRIKMLLSEKNRGIPLNFNRAFDAVTGEFVAFLGGDDLMFPKKIEEQLQIIGSDENIGLVYSDMEVFDTDSNKILYKKSEKGIHPQPLNWTLKVDWYLEKNDTGIVPSACLARSSYYLQARYDSRFYLKHELFFTLEDYYQNPNMRWVYLNKVLGRYRYHANNFSTTSKANQSIVAETFLIADLTMEKYPESKERVMEHIKSYTYHKMLFHPHLKERFPRFKEILHSFNEQEKFHFKLSTIFLKLRILKLYLKIARKIKIV